MSANLSLLLDIKSKNRSIIDSEFTNHFNGDSPLSNKFRINISSLLDTDNFSYVKFTDDKWLYSPDLFCLDYYGSTEYWPVILLVNKLKSRFEFKPNNLENNLIVAPSSTLITRVSAL